MPFKAKYGVDFTIKNNRIHLSTDYLLANNKKFKKITGSRLASIINRNQYTSPAKMWAMMTNIYYEEMDETLSFVGNAIEPKVKKYVEEKLDISFKQYNPFEVKWDVFDDPIFGGIPDGEPIDNNGNFLYDKNLPMLEIKTTSIDSFVYKITENEKCLIPKIYGKRKMFTSLNSEIVNSLMIKLKRSNLK